MARSGWGRSLERDGRSAPGRRAGDLPALSFPVGRRWTIGRCRGRIGAKWPRWPGLPRGKGRLLTPFPAVSQLLPVLQIHFRSHADIYTHSISLIYGILRHSGLSRALFQVLPVPEFYFRSNTGDRKWNANQSVSLSPAIISLQCRLTASSHDFAPIVSKMAAKTISGSGFDLKFGLVAPGFLICNISRRLSARIRKL